MEEGIDTRCGICITHSLHDDYSFGKSQAHRGKDGFGIAAIGYNRIDVVKCKGTLNSFSLEDLHEILPPPLYHTYLFHTRYKTKGSDELKLSEMHPYFTGGKIIDHGSHLIALDCDAVLVHNGQVNPEYLNCVNSSLLKTNCDTEALLHLLMEKGEKEVMKNVPGAYTLAFYKKGLEGVVVMRDRTGIKPGYLGKKDGKYCAASESIAFQKNGGELYGDLIPGTIYYFLPNGTLRKEKILEPKRKECFFEWNYIGARESIINNLSVLSLRETIGEVLAEEFHPDNVDFVTFVPHCPEIAARSYAEKIGKPFVKAFYKMRNERSFQGATKEERQKSISENLFLMPNANLEGKTGIIIDDSLIRGNVVKRVRQLVTEAGMKKAYFVPYTPEVGIIGDDGEPRGCTSGVDMPPDESAGEFIARGKTRREISDAVGMEVYYLSKKGMFDAFRRLGKNPDDLCTFCIGEEKPY